MRNFKIRVQFEPRDLWFGLYWGKKRWDYETRVYLCLIPMLPIVFSWKDSWDLAEVESTPGTDTEDKEQFREEWKQKRQHPNVIRLPETGVSAEQLAANLHKQLCKPNSRLAEEEPELIAPPPQVELATVLCRVLKCPQLKKPVVFPRADMQVYMTNPDSDNWVKERFLQRNSDKPVRFLNPNIDDEYRKSLIEKMSNVDKSQLMEGQWTPEELQNDDLDALEKAVSNPKFLRDVGIRADRYGNLVIKPELGESE